MNKRSIDLTAKSK